MHDIVFDKVCKNYGQVEVVKNLDLHIPAGKRLVLLGPSGCGKTTTLRMIAGLESVTKGNLYMGGQLVNDVEPGDRNVAMVFQNYALYPHMTVWQNISFGMEIAKVPQQDQEQRVNEALTILNLSEYKQRYPRELSGGQRQRVALARALVKRSPYFLLDEPLSNLDAQLRTYARAELVRIHEVYNPTFVYVTHDQVEAMTIGNLIALMHKSVLQQIDTPDVIYNRPANTFVASFIGSPSMNIVDAQVDGDYLRLSGQAVKLPERWREIIGDRQQVKFGIRPEKVDLAYDAGDAPVAIGYVENHGNKKCITFMLNDKKVLATAEPDFVAEGSMFLRINWKQAHFFDSVTGENLGYPSAN